MLEDVSRRIISQFNKSEFEEEAIVLEEKPSLQCGSVLIMVFLLARVLGLSHCFGMILQSGFLQVLWSLDPKRTNCDYV